MKQSGFHTNNPLWKKLSYQLFLCSLAALWKLINTSSDSFDKTFFTKCSHIIILYTFCRKVSSFCNATFVFEYSFYNFFFIQISTNFLHAITKYCMRLL